MEARLGNGTPFPVLTLRHVVECLSLPSHITGNRKHIAGFLNHMQIPFMCPSFQRRLRDFKSADPVSFSRNCVTKSSEMVLNYKQTTNSHAALVSPTSWHI